MLETVEVPRNAHADHEKKKAALSSVSAAILLTSLKIVVGLLTGSLGILSEAAHSALDLVAAAVTYFAVRLSGRAPDPGHTYGYGKIENLSALFETLLLLVTSVWIIYEAINRLFFEEHEVEASIWAFLVMGVSIVVDVTRSRMLKRVADKYESQALEADALHFSTDIWSSSVVIGGLFLVKLSEWLQVEWLAKADAVAAMGVAVIVVIVSLQLGRRAVADLIDAIPPGLREQVIGAVHKVAGVQAVRQVRIRRSGPEFFADITLDVNRAMPMEQMQTVTGQVQKVVSQVLRGADVVVTVSPVASDNESIITRIRLLAARQGLGAHAIRIYNINDKRIMELHLEVGDSITLDQAHAQADLFEAEIRKELPGIHEINTHLEPTGDASVLRLGTQADEAQIWDILHQTASDLDLQCDAHDLKVQHIDGEIAISFHCCMRPDASITDAHATTERIESALRNRIPNLGRVLIHVEPPDQK
jgi:cation diffusion facilitator family transporter